VGTMFAPSWPKLQKTGECGLPSGSGCPAIVAFGWKHARQHTHVANPRPHQNHGQARTHICRLWALLRDPGRGRAGSPERQAMYLERANDEPSLTGS
jgi:hypothetical protein